jgi:hypothetical protein
MASIENIDFNFLESLEWSEDTPLSKSFTVKDLIITQTGIDNFPDFQYKKNLIRLAALLEEVKDKIGPFHILSAFRNAAVNAKVGGSPTSWHKYGLAADIVPMNMSTKEMFGRIIGNDTLKNKMGEIAFKESQNSIHLTVSEIGASGKLIQGKVMYREPAGKYVDLTPNQIKSFEIGGGIKLAAIGIITSIIAIAGFFYIRRK